MFSGVVLALSACFVWGLIFIIPQFMSSFSPLEIALGRYLMFGSLCLPLFIKAYYRGRVHYSRSIWIKALQLPFISTLGYYLFIILALRYTSAAICALLLGLSPIAISVYGNWKKKECNTKLLLWPAFFTALGPLSINAPHLSLTEPNNEYLLGLAAALMALTTWSYYVVENAHFLKANPDITDGDWAVTMGLGTLICSSMATLTLVLVAPQWLDLDRLFLPSPELTQFILGCMSLSLLCSGLGALLWNGASRRLPITLTGSLSIFETIFGLLFVYIVDRSAPPPFSSGSASSASL